jgi:hypothetical protein
LCDFDCYKANIRKKKGPTNILSGLFEKIGYKNSKEEDYYGN